MSTYYVAVLEKNSEGKYFAFVPDLPGVTAMGATRGEALSYAAEFANDWIADAVERKQEVPVARDYDAIEAEPEVVEVGRALIPVEIPGKSVKVTLSMDEAFLDRVDRAAKDEGLTRSGYFVEAAGARLRMRFLHGGGGAIGMANAGGFVTGSTMLQTSIGRGSTAVISSRRISPGGNFLPLMIVPDDQGHLVLGVAGGDQSEESKSGN